MKQLGGSNALVSSGSGEIDAKQQPHVDYLDDLLSNNDGSSNMKRSRSFTNNNQDDSPVKKKQVKSVILAPLKKDSS